MSAFPVTSLTLLQKIAVQVTGEREAAWVRFFGLYEPAIKRFVAWHDGTHDHVPANAKSWSGRKEWRGIPLVFDAK